MKRRRFVMYSLSVPMENEKEKQQAVSREVSRLMELYGNDVLRTSYMYLKNRQNAEDAYQEVFIRVFNKLDGFRGESSEKTWIIKITINVCKDMLRGSWLKKVLLTDRFGSKTAASGIEDRIIRKDDNRLLFEAVLSLPQSFKEVILLYYYHGYDTAEIGGILDIAEGTVRSRLHRGRELLRNELGGRIRISD
jgi:RNA polymerase sigma-70 factor (ECF subfamily)